MRRTGSRIAEIRGPFVASGFIIAGRITGRRTAAPPVLLWELRVPGGSEKTASQLDATSATGDFYGRVRYFHAGGTDRPLLITKEGAESVVPRETWRGQFHAGTSPTTGAVRDCPTGVQTNCLQINWPGMRTNASHAWSGEQPDIRVWYGGLVDGMRDASGQMEVQLATKETQPSTAAHLGTLDLGDRAVYLIRGRNCLGYVVAGSMAVKEDDGEYYSPSGLLQS